MPGSSDKIVWAAYFISDHWKINDGHVYCTNYFINIWIDKLIKWWRWIVIMTKTTINPVTLILQLRQNLDYEQCEQCSAFNLRDAMPALFQGEKWQNTYILWWRIWIFFCFACQFWIAFLFSYFEIRRKFWLLYHRSTTTTTPTITTTTTPTMTTTSTTSTTRTTAATTSSYVSRCYFFLFVFFLIFPDSVEPAIGVTKSDDPMIHQLEDVAENVPSSQNKPLLFLWLDVFF